MATWKRITSDSDQVSWEKKGSKAFVTISSRFVSIDPKKRRNKWKVYAENSNGKNVVNTKNNLTKQNALAYAKVYMKTI